MLFTVIIPVYNVEEYLRKCIDSVLAQTFRDFEVILVDDGSTDGCPQICDEYQEKDPRVRVIHKPNGGLVSARNAGILAAKGDYITYVDGDDWTKPELLQFVHDRLAASPAPLDMVMFAAENVFDDHVEYTTNNLEEGYYDKSRLEKEVYPYMLCDRRNGFRSGTTVQGHTWNKPCRRELQAEHYVRDESIRMFTDIPMTYECLLNCGNVYICNEVLYCYNKMNSNSILAQGKRNYINESMTHLVAYLQERLRGYGIDRQLNDYPVSLIVRCAIDKIRTEKKFSDAVKYVRKALEETNMLSLVQVKGLPPKLQILVILLKARLYYPAMLLCAVKSRAQK